MKQSESRISYCSIKIPPKSSNRLEFPRRRRIVVVLHTSVFVTDQISTKGIEKSPKLADFAVRGGFIPILSARNGYKTP